MPSRPNFLENYSIETLGVMMNDLERQKREAEGKLFDLDEDAEERSAVEAEIFKFERWVEKVQPLLTNPRYTPSYEEQRLAVRIRGGVYGFKRHCIRIVARVSSFSRTHLEGGGKEGSGPHKTTLVED